MSNVNYEKFGELILPRCLDGLNKEQQKAVRSPAHSRLQIIAGPGTGKTKVLISRVAWLVIAEDIPIHNIVVTTFTKKAAKEIIDRLTKMFEGTCTDVKDLLIGTFHSICFRIIKRYGSKMGNGIEKFTIADERDKTHYMEQIFDELTSEEKSRLINSTDAGHLKNYKDKYLGFDIDKIKKKISSLKSKGILPETYSNQNEVNATSSLLLLYKKYQQILNTAQKLDFDDCLLTCYELITKHHVLGYIKHVLVDEFQDTNEVQLQLMYQFAKGNPKYGHTQNNVTIVGDPDQSIYAFRDAQCGNFESMIQHYKKMELEVIRISLNENYRSTQDILQFSESVMRQQRKRIIKELNSQFNDSFKPVYKNLKSSEEEAQWICYQIEHLLNLPNQLFKFSDISILVRCQFQTRVIEAEFMKKKIPYVMIRGKAFWERKEVCAILDYLRLCSDEYDILPVLRTLNYPKRGIGKSTLDPIEKSLKKKPSNVKVTDFLKKLVYEHKLSKKVKNNILEYVKMIEKVQADLKKLDKTKINRDQLANIFDYIYETSRLKTELKDEEKQLNVEEVKNQLLEFQPIEETMGSDKIEKEDEEKEEEEVVKIDENILLQFIHSFALYDIISEELKTQQDIESHGVALSTIHGSKGLEWPIVFVPGLSEGLLPASFAMKSIESLEKDVDEERRCFYVATTRSKLLLYISSYIQNTESYSYRRQISQVSRFIDGFEKNGVFADHQLLFSDIEKLKTLYKMLDKELDEDFKLQRFYDQYKSFWIRYNNNEKIRFKFDNDGFSSAGSLVNSFSTAKRKLEHLKEPDTFKKAAKIKTNKAPPYIPNRAPPSIPNRAPLYIPNRKVN
ncbi:unnamed protein product [Candida verbasci]|uniref:DNA 3'-5' helicase n=1 Tax=Candida verbasci TaxID=1227364 RepID=A0A9W4XLV4_9ASCO|nr:unnamed protein product [Candida verbasci]